MGRIVHRDHLLPVARPAVHVLRVRGGQVLNLAEFAALVHLLDEQELAAVDHGFGHHVLQAGLRHFLNNLAALVDRGGHRHRAHHVLAGVECLQRHPSVVGDRAVDVDKVDIGVGQHVFVTGVAFGDAESLADLVQFRFVAAAQGNDIRLRVCLVDGEELGAEPEANHRDIYRLLHREQLS